MAEKKGVGSVVEDPRINKYLSRYKELQAEKAPWNPHFQRIAEVFLTRKQHFTGEVSPGQFLYDDIYDNTGEYALTLAASVFLSMLWPDSSKTFRLRPVEELRGQPGVDEYFRFMNRQMYRYMDKPRAGLTLALGEHFLDNLAFGTNGLGAFDNDDEDTPVVFSSWGIKGMCISENAASFVDVVYLSDMRTVRQIVEEYGIDNVSVKIRELSIQGKTEEKFEVLKVIEPRPSKERTGKGVMAMKIRSLHIDVANKKLMKESGYNEFPVAVVRMIKTSGEKYGRSPAMIALPDAISLNSLKEAQIVATEKQLDPPLGVLDDGRLGGGTIDTSAGALNVFNASGRLTGEKPVFALFTVGELQSTKELAESFRDSIMQAFSLDRLLDLNNQTQMTAFETSVRNRMRGESLGAMFSRQIIEGLTPTIERTFDILYRKGLLGVVSTGFAAAVRKAWGRILNKNVLVVPEAVIRAIEEGLDIYEIEYISPAQRFMQSEKLQGIFTSAEFLAKLAVVPGAENILDNVDFDKMASEVLEYSGAPISVLRSEEDIKAIRQGRVKQQAVQTKLAAAQQMSEVARNMGQANTSMAGGTGGAQ